jgi:uncharacterized protein (DUF1778 family)
MVKTRFATSESSRSIVVEARASAADAKRSINLRIESSTRHLIDDAAAILGKTRTQFMIESARRQAVDVLLDQRLFTLGSKRYNAFMQALDKPPAPGLKLKALLRRNPAWQKWTTRRTIPNCACLLPFPGGGAWRFGIRLWRVGAERLTTPSNLEERKPAPVHLCRLRRQSDREQRNGAEDRRPVVAACRQL